MTIEITILISVISVSAAIFFGIKSQKRADTDEIEERTRQNTEIKVKLEEALSLLKSMQDELKSLVDRITADEKKTDMLSVKVDNLERRVDKLEKGGTA
jgi:predicted nuclease with TOPRIM domain